MTRREVRADGTFGMPPGLMAGPRVGLVLPFALDMTWTNMPVALTELGGVVNLRRAFLDIHGFEEMALFASVNVAGAITPGATLHARAQNDTGGFVAFNERFYTVGQAGPSVLIDSTGVVASAWERIAAPGNLGANYGGLTVALFGFGGDGVADPRFSVWLQFR